MIRRRETVCRILSLLIIAIGAFLITSKSANAFGFYCHDDWTDTVQGSLSPTLASESFWDAQETFYLFSVQHVTQDKYYGQLINTWYDEVGTFWQGAGTLQVIMGWVTPAGFWRIDVHLVAGYNFFIGGGGYQEVTDDCTKSRWLEENWPPPN